MNVPGDPKATDPFLLLMEDWFPRGVFDRQTIWTKHDVRSCRLATASGPSSVAVISTSGYWLGENLRCLAYRATQP
jgi:hypothetical protein